MAFLQDQQPIDAADADADAPVPPPHPAGSRVMEEESSKIFVGAIGRSWSQVSALNKIKGIATADREVGDGRDGPLSNKVQAMEALKEARQGPGAKPYVVGREPS